MPGVENITVNFPDESAEVTFDDGCIRQQVIFQCLEGLSYGVDVTNRTNRHWLSIIIFLILLAIIGGIVKWGKT